LSWSKKLTQSTENCYSIQQGRVIERSRGRYVSPIRLKNKHLHRSESPSNQSISSVSTSISAASTPTHHLTLDRRVQRHHRQPHTNIFEFDKEVWSTNNDDDDASLKNNNNSSSISLIEARRNKNELSRTICGGSAYSVPYREKRNPLNHTRLSCYKPIYSEPHSFDIHSLKNYKSVDDFLSMDKMQAVEQQQQHEDETPKMPESKDENYFGMKNKRRGFSSKFRSMSDKTQKLFSKLYSSSSNLKATSSSTEVCNDFTLIQPKQQPQQQQKSSISRRSLSYGTLPDAKEFEAKKCEAEDGDSGILVNESGASSMIETESNSSDKSSTASDTKEVLLLLPPSSPDRKYVQR
jgi:hypothetical protein